MKKKACNDEKDIYTFPAKDEMAGNLWEFEIWLSASYHFATKGIV
jgi:hypothetical protein